MGFPQGFASISLPLSGASLSSNAFPAEVFRVENFYFLLAP
jgi:hypothetical protein